jgi:hypothetical protein
MASVTAALASQAGLGGGDGLALHASFMALRGVQSKKLLS